MVSTKMSSREICGVAVVLSCQRVALSINDIFSFNDIEGKDIYKERRQERFCFPHEHFSCDHFTVQNRFLSFQKRCKDCRRVKATKTASFLKN